MGLAVPQSDDEAKQRRGVAPDSSEQGFKQQIGFDQRPVEVDDERKLVAKLRLRQKRSDGPG